MIVANSFTRIAPYVISLVAMKLTVMMLLASNQRNHSLRTGELSADSSVAIVAAATIKAPGEEELKNRRYWQMLDNLEEANIQVSATNRTHASSIWCGGKLKSCKVKIIFLFNASAINSRLIYNRVPRCGGLTMVFLMKELAKVNRFAHQRHQYRTPWNRQNKYIKIILNWTIIISK